MNVSANELLFNSYFFDMRGLEHYYQKFRLFTWRLARLCNRCNYFWRTL